MADTLTITDNRTGKQYEIPVNDGAIRAMDLRQIRASPDDFGLMTYDPAFQNTASCRSRITFIDGDKGILLYRGYPIEQLAETCTFLDVAYRDVVDDETSVIARVYAHCGLTLGDDALERMLRWSAANEQHMHGQHAYSLDESALTRERIEQRFGAYLARFSAFLGG